MFTLLIKTQTRIVVAHDWERELAAGAVFTRTKHGANHLAEQLNKDGSAVRRSTAINRKVRVPVRWRF